MVISDPARASRLTLPVDSFRRIPLPTAVNGDQAIYVAIVAIDDLPDLSDWREINVRDARLTGKVPKAIRETLEEDPDAFVIRNRGLVISTEHVHFDNQSSTVALTLSDKEKHGLLDGGHTYEVIRSFLSDLDDAESRPEILPFVRVELLEGFSLEQIVNVVDARNTSNQVKEQGLLDLQDKFEEIKREFDGQGFADLIAYKEYEIQVGLDENNRRPKPVDVRDIVSLMTVFDRTGFGPDSHPILAYNSKAKCLERFRDHGENYSRLNSVLVDIVSLWDRIHLDLPLWYKLSKEDRGQKAFFGNIRGVSTLPKGREVVLHFIQGRSGYSIPTAFKYPILAALRAFLEERNGRYAWASSPFDALDAGLGKQLTEVVLNAASDFGNPTRLGKASNVWDQCYSKAELWLLRQKVSATS